MGHPQAFLPKLHHRRNIVNMSMHYASCPPHHSKCLLFQCYAGERENHITDGYRLRTREAPDVRDVKEHHGEALDAEAECPALVAGLARLIQDRLSAQSTASAEG